MGHVIEKYWMGDKKGSLIDGQGNKSWAFALNVSSIDVRRDRLESDAGLPIVNSLRDLAVKELLSSRFERKWTCAFLPQKEKEERYRPNENCGRSSTGIANPPAANKSLIVQSTALKAHRSSHQMRRRIMFIRKLCSVGGPNHPP